MQLFRRKSSATIRQSSIDSTSSSPPSPSPSSSSQENVPSVPHRLFRRKSNVNIRPATDNGSPQEAPPSPPRRLFRRKSSVTIRPSTATQVTATTSSPTQEEPTISPRPYTSAASPPPIPTQFLQPLPAQPDLVVASTASLAPPASSNPYRASNRFSTTSTLFEREVPAPAPPARPSPLAQIQQSPIESYVTQAREADLQRLGYDAMMALAWVQAEERRRAATSRGWQHDPWRGGFGPSNTAERIIVAPVPALRVQTALNVPNVVATSSPGAEVQERVVQERSGNGLRERLGRRGLMKSQSIFNLKWRVRDVV